MKVATSSKQAKPVKVLIVLFLLFAIGIGSLIAGSIFLLVTYTPKLGLDLKGGTINFDTYCK